MQPIYIVLIVIVCLAVLLGIIYSAGSRLMDMFQKYDKVPTRQGINTVALLYFLRDTFELDFDIRRIHGKLTDCYIPSKKIIAVSDATFNNSSVAAVAIVSHEVGHAIQHKKSTFLFNLHRFVGGVVSIFGRLVVPTAIASLVFILLGQYTSYALIALYIAAGILVAGILFKLFTIPIEYSASSIALGFLKDYQILNDEELKIAKKFTDAAAFTYVAEFIKDILGLNLFRRRN